MQTLLLCALQARILGICDTMTARSVYKPFANFLHYMDEETVVPGQVPEATPAAEPAEMPAPAAEPAADEPAA